MTQGSQSFVHLPCEQLLAGTPNKLLLV